MNETSFQRMPITKIDFNAAIPSNNGCQDRESIFISVGRALSSWELVETCMADMYWWLIEFDADKSRSYGSKFNSSKKAELLKKAASTFLPKYIPSFSINEFELLCQNYIDAAMRRNEIAHGIVKGFILNGNVNAGLFLGPASYNTIKNKERTPQFYENAIEKADTDPFYAYGMNFRFTDQDIDYFNSLFECLRVQSVQLNHLISMSYITKNN
ncbi:MAG TPA: hypothetical protein PKL53_08635 [Methylotenera sp.]|nr:hypothetical protein [Methylotenera sp.]HPV45288.1 hypothetical protein [Methylotenera sp.]